MNETMHDLEDRVGPEQEDFGGTIVGGSTHDALTNFMEAKNAAMMPLLDSPGLAALYSLDAEFVTPLNGLPETHLLGRAAIEEYFARIGDVMQSLVHVERRRTVEGRRAVWEGTIEGVQTGSRHALKIPAVFSLQFDDHDLVEHQWSFFSIHEARKQLDETNM